MIVLLGAFEAMSTLRTMETREMLERFLSEPPGSALGLDFEGARRMRHVAILVLAASAAAAAILGWFALRRDRVARIALSVLAVPLFVAGSIAGGFASAVVTVSIVMLWLEPARSWFAGRPLPERFRLPREGGRTDERPARPGGGASPYLPPHQPGRPSAGGWGTPGAGGTPGPGDGPTQAPWGRPGAEQPPAQQPAQQPWGPPHGQQPAPYQGFGSAPQGPWGYGAAPAHRPTGVLVACIVTWVASGLAALGMIASTVVLAADPGGVLAELTELEPALADQGVTTELLVGLMVTVTIVVVAWSIASSVFAFYALRRAGWARIALIVSAGVAVGLGLLMALSAPPLLFFVAAAGATVGLLLNRDVSRWYAARGQMRS